MIDNSLEDAGFSRNHMYMTMIPNGILGNVPIQVQNCDTPVYFDNPKNVFDVYS